MVKSGKLKIGSLIAIAMLLAGNNASVTSMTYQEFKDAPVTDSRMEASCHNFADNGAFYEFKIIGGRVFYSREGGVPSEYAYLAGLGSAAYMDHKRSRNSSCDFAASVKKPVPAAGFEMIAARNNRLLAKAAGSDSLYWSGIVMEYGKDYFNGTSWVDVQGTYSKVDPQEFQGPGNPAFWGNSNNHFGSSLFSNNNPLAKLPKALDFLDGVFKLPGAPDLEWVSRTNFVSTLTTTAGPIMKDVMEVRVQPGIWYLIDATPPRNELNASVSQLSANNGFAYQQHKRLVAKQLSAYMVKVGTGLVDDISVAGVNLAEFRKFFTDAVNIAADIAKAPLWVLSGDAYWWVFWSAFFGDLTAQTTLATHYANEAARSVVDATANSIKSNINNISVAKYLEPIELFYNTNVDFALDLPENLLTNPVEFDLALNKAILTNTKTLKDKLLETACGKNRSTLIGLVSQSFVDEIEKQTNDFADRFVESFKDFNLLEILPSELINAPKVDLSWADVSLGINRWYQYFKYPSDVFEMENINLKTEYPAGGNTQDFIKTRVKIKKIIDLGIAQSCRFEHYRFHHGCEWGTFFGEIKSPESWDLKTSDPDKPFNMFSAYDGHGFLDGTCNFYLLAEVGIWDAGQGKYVDKPALLWIDEQEYFAERWHVFHPRDNVFEGLAGTLGSAFTALTIFNGLDIQDFANNFWDPYQQLTQNARMATSGTATVIANDSCIYSASMYWALTDKTWRWRNYPDINETNGESIDKKSVALRDDMTITFRGKKNVKGTVVDGYWYQRYLDPNNQKTAGAGEPFTHPWRFMAKEVFDFADKNFFRMGMYEQATEPAGNPSQHYSYKGYTPRTHVYTFAPGATVQVKSGGATQTIAATLFVNNAYDPNNVYGTYLDQNGSKPITSPMYDAMKMQYASMVPTIKLRFGITDGVAYACFADIRNDDVRLPAQLAEGVKTFYCRPENGADYAIAINTDNLKDLNVWADAPIDRIYITHNSATNKYGFQFTLNDCGRYNLTQLKIGYISGGIVQTLPVISLADPVVFGNYATYTSAGNDISQELWETCFSEDGMVKYGTSVWVVDAFGNGNTIENIASAGVPAPAITAITAATSKGPIEVKPAISGQPISFDLKNGGGAITSTIWDFGDGTPAVTSLTPPVHRYTKPGTYVVTVTAIGPDFSDVKKITISIRPSNLTPIIRFLNN